MSAHPPTSSIETRLAVLETELARSQSTLMELESASGRSPGVGRALLILAASLALGAATPTDGTTARAPFVVVDGSNQPIFAVHATNPASHDLTIYRDGEPVILGVARDKSSFWKTMSQDGNTVAVIGQQDGTTPGMFLRTGGAYNNRIAAVVVDGKPMLSMTNEYKETIVNLTLGQSGGGLLQLLNAKGQEIVAAAMIGPGVGIVRADPVGRAGVNLPKTGIIRGTGLPATFICGVKCSQ